MLPHSTPFFPQKPNDYAPWVSIYGLVAPYGKCQCGCGQDTWVSTKNDPKYLNIKGLPVRFVHGHYPKRQAVPEQACANCGRIAKLKAHGECSTCYGHRRTYGKPRDPDKPLGPVRDIHSPNWKGDAATTNTKRKRAHVRFKLGPCEQCGKPGVDRHHKDGDTGNNESNNIVVLCRRCHMIVDGRMDRFKQSSNAGKVKPPSPCINCGRMITKRRLGRCDSCREYLKNHEIDKPHPP